MTRSAYYEFLAAIEFEALQIEWAFYATIEQITQTARMLGHFGQVALDSRYNEKVKLVETIIANAREAMEQQMDDLMEKEWEGWSREERS